MSEVATSVVSNASAPIQGEAEVQESQTVETPEVVAVPEKKDDFLAPKFAALSRKEKQVRAEEARIKAERAEIQRLREEYESKSKTSQDSESEFMAKLKKNPLKTLSEMGFSYEQLTQMQLNDENPTPQMLIEQMRAEMEEKYSKELNSVKETLKEKEEREAKDKYEAAVSGYRSELSSFVESNADKYELIVANDATDLMFETAEAFYEATKAEGKPRVPSHQEIADAVEAHLEERAREILKLKKFQTAPKTEAKPGAKNPQTAPTLSNTLAAEVPKSGLKLLTEDQSKKEAAKLLRWNE
ncbi:MAG: hypothetical protein ACAH17_00130 [Candidatus Paceibacterota bacterium]